MCGIAGAMSSVLSVGEVGIFKDLLNISSIRGYQGSGAIVVTEREKRQEVRTIKSQMISGWLAYSPNLAALLDKQPSILVGHARWPTKGGMDKSALHPHRMKHIAGVHNGTLFQVNDTLIKEGESDSKALFAHIAEVGIEEAWAKKTGAAALVYVNEEDQTLNFIRNGQRPLHFKNIGWQKNISTLYWASTPEILNFGVSQGYKGTNSWDTYLPTDQLYSYPLDPEVRIVPTRTLNLTPKPTVGWTSHGNRFWEGWDDAWPEQKAAQETETTEPWMEGRYNSNRSGNVTSNVQHLPVIRPPTTISDRAKQARDRALLKLTHYIDHEGISRPIPAGYHLEYDNATKTRKLMRDREANGLPRPSFLCTPTSDGKDERDARAFAEAELNDAMPDLAKRRIVGLVGRCCVWCGDPASVGDSIFRVHSNAGRDDILCTPCSTEPDCIPFLGKNPETITVGM